MAGLGAAPFIARESLGARGQLTKIGRAVFREFPGILHSPYAICSYADVCLEIRGKWSSSGQQSIVGLMGGVEARGGVLYIFAAVRCLCMYAFEGGGVNVGK